MPEFFKSEIFKPYVPVFFEFVQSALLCLFILIVGWILSKWARKLALRALRKVESTDQALDKFLSGIAQYLTLAVTAITALAAVGVETTSVIALLGSAGIAVGLALQGNLSHFASGVMILFFRPFSIDDVVTVSGHTGVVREIGLFATTLHTPDNQTIIVPNGAITGGSIVNITALGTRRGAIDIGVAYGEDMDKIQALLLKAAGKADMVLSDPEPAVAFVEFGASSLNFKVFVWARCEDYLPALHNTKVAVYDVLNEAGVDIPYDQVVVHQASTDA